jgi:hypothetical protein
MSAQHEGTAGEPDGEQRWVSNAAEKCHGTASSVKNAALS